CSPSLPHFSSSACSFIDAASADIHSLSLHDALPIWCQVGAIKSAVRRFKGAPTGIFLTSCGSVATNTVSCGGHQPAPFDSFRGIDRKSTRLNSSHVSISYAVFCLKKKIKEVTVGWTS